jgi:hypothetical protein
MDTTKRNNCKTTQKQGVLGGTKRLLSFQYILSIRYYPDSIARHRVQQLLPVYSLPRERVFEPWPSDGFTSGSNIPAFRRKGKTQTHRQKGDLIIFLFFQNKESMLNTSTVNV